MTSWYLTVVFTLLAHSFDTCFGKALGIQVRSLPPGIARSNAKARQGFGPPAATGDLYALPDVPSQCTGTSGRRYNDKDRWIEGMFLVECFGLAYVSAARVVACMDTNNYPRMLGDIWNDGAVWYRCEVTSTPRGLNVRLIMSGGSPLAHHQPMAAAPPMLAEPLIGAGAPGVNGAPGAPGAPGPPGPAGGGQQPFRLGGQQPFLQQPFGGQQVRPAGGQQQAARIAQQAARIGGQTGAAVQAIPGPQAAGGALGRQAAGGQGPPAVVDSYDQNFAGQEPPALPPAAGGGEQQMMAPVGSQGQLPPLPANGQMPYGQMGPPGQTGQMPPYSFRSF